MKKNLTYLLSLVICLVITQQSFGQLDNNTDSKKKGKTSKSFLPVPSKKLKKPSAINPKSTSGFKNAYNTEEEKRKAKQKKLALQNKGILTRAKLNEESWNKNYKKINGQYPKIDQDLGSFRSQSKYVNVICRDYQYPDGDRVTIYINDIPVVYNIVLQQSYQSFKIPLEVGINKIAFKALNQGTSGPNTAGFKVYDDSGSLISSNEWNLATGAKATILIAKDK